MLLKDLTTLTASLASGTLFHVEKSGKAYNIDYTKLAKAIVEEYNGSTLGGSAQTVQAAIAALNSRTTLEAIPLTANSDVLEISTANTYAIGSLIVFSGWLMFKSGVETISQGTTLFTIGGNKLFQTRYYMPLCNGRNDFLSALECRESTNVVRARAGFTPVPATYYYLSGACCIK